MFYIAAYVQPYSRINKTLVLYPAAQCVPVVLFYYKTSLDQTFNVLSVGDLLSALEYETIIMLNRCSPLIYQ